MKVNARSFGRFGLIVTFAVNLAAIARSAQAGEVKPPLPLQGKLVELTGKGPALRIRDKDYPLSARTSWLFHSLEDKRLTNREIRAEGAWATDGTFQVSQFCTVKDGKLYRVRYFCEVCNLEALEPGNCLCCQEPTELQEIPLAGK